MRSRRRNRIAAGRARVCRSGRDIRCCSLSVPAASRDAAAAAENCSSSGRRGPDERRTEEAGRGRSRPVASASLADSEEYRRRRHNRLLDAEVGFRRAMRTGRGAARARCRWEASLPRTTASRRRPTAPRLGSASCLTRARTRRSSAASCSRGIQAIAGRDPRRARRPSFRYRRPRVRHAPGFWTPSTAPPLISAGD